MSIIISQLFIYPVKSLPGLSVQEMSLDALGAINDRRYMLVDEQGLFVTQRQFAQLVFAEIEIVKDGWCISLPNQGSRILPRNGKTITSINIKVWNDQIQAYDQGDEWSKWFSIFLEKSVRLVFTDFSTTRLIDANYCKEQRQVSFTDGFPLLLTNKTSLDVLNSALVNHISMERFRPNIVVSGSKAFAENSWQQLKLGSLALNLVKPCSRCVIPTINLNTGKKDKSVWQVLEQFCRREDGKVYFGQNVIHSNAGVLKVGEELTTSYF